MINIEVYSTHAVIRSQQPLTVGLTGAKAHFTFGDPWGQLIKAAVFRQGEKTVTVTDIGEQVQIPWEVLTLPGVPVMIGVYGKDAEEKLVIPTLWAETEPVRPGAEPNEDTSAEPTQGMWEQMQSHMGSLEHLQTNDKTSLVAAVNEANRAVCLVKVSQKEDGTYAIDTDIPALLNAYSDGKTLICDLSGVLMHLTSYSSTGLFEFTSIKNNTKFCVTILPDGTVTYTNTVLATNQSKLPNPKKLTFIGNATAEYDGSEEMIVGIPTKVSQLQNDSHFLTEAVTSVNGQTGDVTLPTTLMVTVTKQADGSYVSDKTVAELRTAFNAGEMLRCWYYDDDAYLPLTYCHGGFTFSAAVNQYLYQVTINPGGNSETKVLFTKTDLSSGGADGLYLDQETGMLYLMSSGQVIGNGVQLPTAEGGPTNNAVLTLENTSGWSEKTVSQEQLNCTISFNWSSVEGGVSTGPGTLTVKVNQALKYSAAIKQGDHSFDIRQYLSLGDNLVHVSVTDFYGNSQTIPFGIAMYDPAALKSTKLVERTLTGDYVNERVTAVGEWAFGGLTLNKLSLPKAKDFNARPFGDFVADEVELASAPDLAYWMFRDSNIKVVKLPSVTAAYSQALNEAKIERLILNSLETFEFLPAGWATNIVLYDFHSLKTLSAIPTMGALHVIIRTPEVCTLQNSSASSTASVYVPEALVDSYKAATNWTEIADRIFAIEEHPDICGGE